MCHFLDASVIDNFLIFLAFSKRKCEMFHCLTFMIASISASFQSNISVSYDFRWTLGQGVVIEWTRKQKVILKSSGELDVRELVGKRKQKIKI
jgi:hypothetical protein